MFRYLTHEVYPWMYQKILVFALDIKVINQMFAVKAKELGEDVAGDCI